MCSSTAVELRSHHTERHPLPLHFTTSAPLPLATRLARRAFASAFARVLRIPAEAILPLRPPPPTPPPPCSSSSPPPRAASAAPALALAAVDVAADAPALDALALALASICCRRQRCLGWRTCTRACRACIRRTRQRSLCWFSCISACRACIRRMRHNIGYPAHAQSSRLPLASPRPMRRRCWHACPHWRPLRPPSLLACLPPSSPR